MDDIILKTKRLILRYQREEDINYLVELWMDEDMTKYTGGPREKAFLIDEFSNTAKDPKKHEYDLWIIELNNSNEIIGQAGFIPKEINGKEHIELNYYIEKAKWNKGYGKEIAMELVNYAFTQKKLERIISIIDPDNEASIMLAKAIGMKYWMNDERSGKTKILFSITNKAI
jgi:RimJ/RimL family protein N-acetyltransferase